MREGTLPNKRLALELFDLPENDKYFRELSNIIVNQELESKIL